MKESQLQAKIIQLLKSRGIWTVKFHAGPKTTTGVPDIICCHRGHFMALEVKLPGNNPTPIQIHQQTKIRQNGGTSEVVTSVDDVIEILRRIDNERNDNA